MWFLFCTLFYLGLIVHRSPIYESTSIYIIRNCSEPLEHYNRHYSITNAAPFQAKMNIYCGDAVHLLRIWNFRFGWLEPFYTYTRTIYIHLWLFYENHCSENHCHGDRSMHACFTHGTFEEYVSNHYKITTRTLW